MRKNLAFWEQGRSGGVQAFAPVFAADDENRRAPDNRVGDYCVPCDVFSLPFGGYARARVCVSFKIARYYD